MRSSESEELVTKHENVGCRAILAAMPYVGVAFEKHLKEVLAKRRKEEQTQH